jgi:hypothetical protein
MLCDQEENIPKKYTDGVRWERLKHVIWYYPGMRQDILSTITKPEHYS